MSARRLELAMARQRLLARSGVLREQVAVQSAALAPALLWGDRIRDAGWWARAHPEWMISAVVVVAIVRPRAAWRWTLRAWGAWRFMRRWQGRLAAMQAGL